MPIYRQVPSRPQGARTRQGGHYQRMSGSMIAGPRFDSRSERTESGEERLAFQKYHEGRAKAVRAMRGYGTTASSAERTSPIRASCVGGDGLNRHAYVHRQKLSWARARQRPSPHGHTPIT